MPDSQWPVPYSSTPVFDEVSLPAGLRREHRTNAGARGIARVLEGSSSFRSSILSKCGLLGEPDDIANVVAFLAGPDRGWVNGQIVRATGGIV